MKIEKYSQNCIAVLQARTSSSRLPAKALLPVRGYPLVVLSAMRACNTGLPVVVATSNEKSDDLLVQTLEKFAIPYFRGSLANVLERIVLSLSKFDSDTIVFRLTADNVVPDGELLEELRLAFIEQDVKYLCCNSEDSGLPYGLSAEIMRLATLREALNETTVLSDLEHVTPYVRRKYGVKYFDKYKSLGLGHFRCTVDCIDDYFALQDVFQETENPIEASFRDLLAVLQKSEYQPTVEYPVRKMVLGTAQFGLDYGITNMSGLPSFSEAEKMVKSAIINGVEYIDTARAYGDSEKVIGSILDSGWAGRAKLITKLDPFENCDEDLPDEAIEGLVDASLYRSLSELRMRKIPVLMIHRADHIYRWKGKVWGRLKEFKQSDIIGALGVSVQTVEELSKVIESEDVEYIQLPFNVLDWRWKSVIPKILRQQSARRLIVHARSPLLQGLLASGDATLWERAHVGLKAFKEIDTWLSDCCKSFNREDNVDLCLAFVLSQPWINGITIGAASTRQVERNVHYFSKRPLSEAQVDTLISSRPKVLLQTLNPGEWRR